MDDHKQIKIAIVDDHILLREGLAQHLSDDPHMSVVFQAMHGADMLQKLEQAADLPDIIIIDLQMPVMDGFSLTDELKRKYPLIRILILSGYSSEYNVASMINKGVSGYMIKECSPDDFRKAIHNIYETGYYYSEVANEQLFKIFQGNTLKNVQIPDREMEFLKLCCTSLRYDQMAAEMGISINTLHGFRERLFDRLSVNSRTGLILFALKSGISANGSNKLKVKL